MGWLIIGCFLAVLVFGAMVWYANTEVAKVKKALVSLAFTGLLIAAIFLIVNVARGNIGLLPLLIFMVPVVRRLRGQGGSQDFSSKFRNKAASRSTMSRAEALEVLGLKEGASEQDIKAAYRKLIASAHPDAGGSDWMAAKLNEAKQILLNKK